MIRQILGAFIALVLTIPCALTVVAQEFGPPATIALRLPTGAKATAEGKEIHPPIPITINDIKPSETRRLKVLVTFADNTTDEREIDVTAGQHFTVAVPQRGLDKPTTIGTQTLTPITAAALSHDGQFIALAMDAKVVLWDTKSGQPERVFTGHQRTIHTVTFSPNSKQLLTASGDATVVLWDVATARILRTFKKNNRTVFAAAFSPDGEQILTGSADNTATIWNANNGEVIHTLAGHTKEIMAVAYSPDGTKAATASGDRTTTIWDTATGKSIVVLKGHREEVSCVAFTPDGKCVGTGSWENISFLWDPLTGKKLRESSSKHSGDVYSIAFTPNGQRYISGDRDEGVMMWETATGKKLRTFAGHNADVVSIAPRADGRVFLTGSRDGTARLWDLATGAELLTLTTDPSGRNWAVVAPNGLFDATEAGRRMLGFRFAKNPAAEVDQFFEGSYHPGLLAEVWRGERPFALKTMARSKPPLVKIVSPKSRVLSPQEAAINVEMTDQGGGVSGLTVEVNGTRVAVPIETKVNKDGPVTRATFTASLAPGVNRLRVKSANADGSWESVPAEIELTVARTPEHKSRMYVVSVGVAKYAEPTFTLRTPVADAKALADLLRNRGAKLQDRVDVVSLLGSDATKANIEDTIHDVAALTKPQDTMVVVLCGYGAFQNDHLVFAPYDLQKGADAPDIALQNRGLAVEDIAKVMGSAKAFKRALVVDVATKAEPKDQSPFALRGYLERQSRRQAVHFLVAVTTSKAGDLKDFENGILTRGLLAAAKETATAAIETKATDTAEATGGLDVMDWFHAAKKQSKILIVKHAISPQLLEGSTQAKGFPILAWEK